MSVLGIIVSLLIGMILLGIGILTKKKWVLIVSSIPLGVAIFQIGLLLLMALH